jgi:hypothetical protein
LLLPEIEVNTFWSNVKKKAGTVIGLAGANMAMANSVDLSLKGIYNKLQEGQIRG